MSGDRTVAKSFVVEKTSDDTESVEVVDNVVDNVVVPSAPPDSPAQSTKTGPTISSATDALCIGAVQWPSIFVAEKVGGGWWGLVTLDFIRSAKTIGNYEWPLSPFGDYK